MKTIGHFALIAVALALILSGCSLTREPVRPREEFFRPVKVISQRNRLALSSADIEQLKSQLESATKSAMLFRDSLFTLQQFAGSLLSSTRALVDKVSELETKEYLATNKQIELEQSVAVLQTENKQFDQQLKELRTRLFAGNVSAESSVYSNAKASTNLRNEYSDALSLFNQHQYDDAMVALEGVLNRGIEEDLADNCQYWIGECRFAKQDYRQAINYFQKVLTIDSSNKKVDAYFMLGKSYEQVSDLVKARWAYEELSLLYPNNSHARFVKVRLEAIKRVLPLPGINKNKKTTA